MAFDPDKYLASKQASFDPDKYLQSKGLSETEDPGMLKSAAAGLMSGIPLAETATSGIMALGDKTYEQSHKELEDLKDRAWEKHPVAYGTGKVAGMAGTAVVAPEALGALGVSSPIAQAAIQGAGYGADLSSNFKDAPKDIAMGAAGGAAAGVVGEKVISPLINKVFPAVAKGAVTALVPGQNAAEAVEMRMANPEALKNAVNPVQAGEKMEGFMNNVKSAIGHLSDEARGKLSPSSFVDTKTEIAPIIEGIKQSFLTEGVEAGGANSAAIKEMANWESVIGQISAKNNGRIPDSTLAELVRDIRGNANYNPQTATAGTDTTNNALKQLSRGLDQILKGKNTDYAEAMKPVSELADLSKKVAKNFNITKAGGELQATDATSGKLTSILKDNKSNAQEVLQKFSDLTGYDFLGNAKNAKLNEAFTSGDSTSGITHALTALGYGAGHMTHLPMGGIVGAMGGRLAGQQIDGGAIAARLIDAYMNKSASFASSKSGAALQKFGPLLIKAAKQGGNNLAATHFVLATSNPEYQQLVDEHSQNQEQ